MFRPRRPLLVRRLHPRDPHRLLLRQPRLQWWPSEALDGYGELHTVALSRDEATSPSLLRASPHEALFLADMTGDGLLDLVRVRASSVCYWPNLGYGRFGPQVIVGNAPAWPRNTFDPARVRWVDVDGSGTADLLYLDAAGVHLARNLSGNTFAARERVTALPPVSSLSQVDAVDLLGDGTACLVWSTSQAGTTPSPLRFVRLMAAGKPHLLQGVDHGTGLTVALSYTPSTRLYVEARAAGRGWATRLPFPVHCLTGVVVQDAIRPHTLTTAYAYHHGFYDPVERQFRGFGRVDQWDTETAGEEDLTPVVPVRTTSWFHTGAWVEASTLEAAYAAEWFAGDALAPAAPVNTVPTGLTPAERREAAWALKGQLLRQEVWRADGTSAAPYAVSTQNYQVVHLQPRRLASKPRARAWERDADIPGAWQVVPRGGLSLAYDEAVDDPRVQQTVVLEVDDYGTPLRTAVAVWPRRGTGHEDEQLLGRIVVDYRAVVNDDTDPDRLHLAVPWQVRHDEVGALSWSGSWDVATLADELATVTETLGPHAATPSSGTWRRLVSQSVQRYADPTTGDPLPLGEVGEVVLPYDVRVLAMTTELFDDPDTDLDASGLDTRADWSSGDRDDALEEGGYVLGTTWVDLTTLEALAEAATDTPEEAEALLLSWWSPPADPIWAPSGTTTYDDAAGFFLPLTQTDPFGTVVTQSYDAFGLRPVGVSVTVEGVAHAVSAVLDAHTLAPVELTDVNDAVTVAAFDPLGRVTKVANLGRAGETVDDLDHPTATFSYTFASFADDTWTPASAHTATRRVHWMGSETTDYDEAWVYFDGSGRELLSKAKAAPHPSTPSTPRFIGSGRVLLDAKGNPVKQYEPYFSATSDFEPDGGFDGVTPILTYDPLGRLVRTDFPDGTHATVARTPWSETHYDRADTLPDIDGYTPDPIVTPDPETLLQAILREFEAGVPGTLATGHPWLDARGNTSVAGVDDFLTVARGKALRRSAGQSWAGRNTPTVVHVDPLGRPFLEQRAKTSTAGDTTDVHVTLDLQGHATAISARYVPEGETVRVTQLATTDVFDLLGRSLRHVRRDAQASGGTGGQTWVLPSVDGQPIRTWDSRDQAFRRTFDALRRPRATFVEVGSGGEVCRLFTRYGEWATTPKSARLLGQPWRVYDTAGLVTTLAVDVDNRVTSTARRFLEAFRGLPDWTAHEDDPDTATDPNWLQNAAGADPEVYTQTATLDIAGRPLHDAVYRDVAAQHERRYAYDAGGHLVSVEVQSPGTSGWRPVVHDVTYNARGQRTKVLAGDDTGDASLETTYSYDADTFRLVRLSVTRLTDDEVLQDIRWVHDAVGNVTFQEDLGTDAVWFDNTTVQPHRKYAYDALDRLIEATGREHQSTFSATGGDTRQTHRPYGLGPKAHAADGNALRSYTQRYTYDDVGNLLELRHIAGGTPTNRTYAYTEEVDGSNHNNRLLSTTVGSTTYPLTYDAHGNVTSMSHLPEMAWDAFDRLASVQTTARYPDVGADDEDEDELETPVDHDWFYVYDGAGQRVRKVRASGSSGVGRWEERLYVGPFEVWRKYDGSGDTSVERETLHVQDGDRRVAMVETLTWDGGAEETSPVARWRYQLDDHLGTACGEVTETGLVIGWEEYHPYGTTAVWSFDATREVSGKRYRYTGMERDSESGMQYHSARFYSPAIARWLQIDPIEFGGNSTCMYNYCSGRPVSSLDDTGQGDEQISERALREEFYNLMDKAGIEWSKVKEVPLHIAVDGAGSLKIFVDDVAKVAGFDDLFAVEFKADFDPISKKYVWTSGQLSAYPALAEGATAVVGSQRLIDLNLPKGITSSFTPLLVHGGNYRQVRDAFALAETDPTAARQALEEAGAIGKWSSLRNFVGKAGQALPVVGLLLLAPEAKAAWDSGGAGKVAVFAGVQIIQEVPWLGTAIGASEVVQERSYTEQAWDAIQDPVAWLRSVFGPATPDEAMRALDSYDRGARPAGARGF